MKLPESKLTTKQTKQFRKDYMEDRRPVTIIAEVRHDDECGNGHNSFAITGDIYTADRYPGETTLKHESGATLWQSGGGCIHDEIAKHFPNLGPFIKWHGTSTDGPLHYFDNTVFMASERDCWGCLKGDPRSYETKVKHGHFPILFDHDSRFVKWLQEVGRKVVEDCEVLSIAHEDKPGETYKFAPKYTLGGFPASKWHECPFDTGDDALNFIQAVKEFGLDFVKTPTQWGEGKARELDAARRAAAWPDATDEQLMQEPEALKAALEARLPALMLEFKAAVESLGFVY